MTSRSEPAPSPRPPVPAETPPTAAASARRVPGAGKDELRLRVREQERRARLRWYFVLAGVLLLVSIFSGGLFLYAVAVLTALYLASAWMSASVMADIRVWRQISTTETEVGQAVEARVVVQNRKGLPAPWLLWHDPVEKGIDVEGARGAFRTLGAGEKAHLSYRLHPYRRGLFRLGPTVVEGSDPFGLVRRYRVDDRASFLTVLPRVVPMGQGWPLGHKPIHEVPRRRSLFEDPSRFLGIREYRQGDSRRRIHWRASARAQTLQVKLFEPSVLDGVFLALEMGAEAFAPVSGDPTGAGEMDPVEELAVTTAASVANWVLGAGQSVGLISNGGDAAERYPADWQGGSFRRLEDVLSQTESRRRPAGLRPLELAAAKGDRQWQRLRMLLARATPASGPVLSELLTAELPSLPRNLVILIISPRLDGALVACAGALRRSGMEVGVIWVGDRRRRGQAQSGPGEGRPSAAAGLPLSVPVYRVEAPSDLERLGNRRL